MSTNNVTPTFVVGLGGTGKKVVLQLKQRLYDSYGPRKSTEAYPEHVGYPIFKFLCLDTDSNELDLVYNAQDKDKKGRRAPEQVALKKTGDWTDFLHLDVNPDVWNSYKSSYSVDHHINSWIPSDFFTRNNPSMLRDGAGQNRLAGRLAFFHHFNRISQLITSSFTAIAKAIGKKDMWIKELKPEIQLNLGDQQSVQGVEVQVFIVASLAGGTGCGIFIDTALLIKTICAQANLGMRFIARIYPIIVLPGAFDLSQEQQNKTHANAYAALKEIELISQMNDLNTLKYPGKESNIEINWTKNQSPLTKYNLSTKDPEIPWEYIYLIDKTNMNICMVDNHSLISMVSDMIYCNYDTSALPSELKTLRSNTTSKMKESFKDDVTLDRTKSVFMTKQFSIRYSSFGLSAYRYDRDKLRRRAAHLMMKKIFEYWKTSLKSRQMGDTDIIVESNFGNIKDLSQSTLEKDQQAQGLFNYKILSMLLLSKDESIITKAFSDIVTENSIKGGTIFIDLEEDINKIKPDEESSSINSEILSEIYAKHNISARSSFENIKSQASKNVNNISDLIKKNLKLIKSSLWEIMIKKFKNIVSEHGVDRAKESFNRLLELIDSYEHLVNEYSDAASLEYWDCRINDAKKIWISGMRKRAISWEVERVCKSVHDNIKCKYFSATSSAIKEIYKDVREIVNIVTKSSINSERLFIIKAIDEFESLIKDQNPKGKLVEYVEKIENFLNSGSGNPDPRVFITVDEQSWNETILSREIAKQFGNKKSLDEILSDDIKPITDMFYPKISKLVNKPIDSLGSLIDFLTPIGELNPGGVKISDLHIEKIYLALMECCSDFIKFFASNINVADTFTRDSDYSSKVSALARYSAPYLSPSKIGSKFSKTDPDIQLIAYKETNTNIKDLLKNSDISVSFDRLKHINMDDDSIIVYQEICNYPLAFINQIKSLGTIYDNVDVALKPEMHLCPEFSERSPDIRNLQVNTGNEMVKHLKLIIKAIITQSLVFQPAKKDLQDRYALHDSVKTTYHRTNLDRLVDDLKNYYKELSTRIDKWETKYRDSLNAFFGYWIGLKRLWIDLRYQLNNNNESNVVHPIMELVEKDMIPELEENKLISNHPEFQKTIELWEKMKSDEIETPGKYFLEFCAISGDFLEPPHENLKDPRKLGFPMWVLKRQYIYSA